MDSPSSHFSVEPLFAHYKHVWLRLWLIGQTIALAVAAYTTVVRAGGVDSLSRSPAWGPTLGAVLLLVVYHAIAARHYEWILRRRVITGAFVLFGWCLIFWSLSLHGAFSLLVLGAVIQGFLFLPFSWAIGSLVALTATIVGRNILNLWPRIDMMIAPVAGLLGTSAAIGTIMFYIDRTNRDTDVRVRLLSQLEATQRDLTQRARDAGVQDERQRLARDIHDTVAQSLASVIRQLDAMEFRLLGDDPSPAAVHSALLHLSDARGMARAGLEEIRRLVFALQPPQLTDTTISGAIERLVAAWSARNDIVADCRADALPPLSPDAEVIFLRAAQEALSNVARHASASEVRVTLQAVDELVLLTVEDNGRGMADTDSPRVGKFGIAGMQERVRRFSGRVLIESRTGCGTSITVALPIDARRAVV